MTSYKIVVEKKALKALGKIETRHRRRIERAIDKLRDKPRPSGYKKLTDSQSLYRIRVGKYRVIYEIRDKELIVLVVVIDHRSKAYRKK